MYLLLRREGSFVGATGDVIFVNARAKSSLHNIPAYFEIAKQVTVFRKKSKCFQWIKI